MCINERYVELNNIIMDIKYDINCIIELDRSLDLSKF